MTDWTIEALARDIAGWSADGRPLAFQVVGRPFDEATVLRLGCVWEVSSGASGRLLEPHLVD